MICLAPSHFQNLLVVLFSLGIMDYKKSNFEKFQETSRQHKAMYACHLYLNSPVFQRKLGLFGEMG